MLPALGAAWGCNGEGFKGRPMRDHAEGPLGLPFYEDSVLDDLNLIRYGVIFIIEILYTVLKLNSISKKVLKMT